MHVKGGVAIFVFVLFLLLFNVQEIFAENNSALTDSLAGVTRVEEVHSESNLPSALMVIPFIALLAMIATGPLFYHHFWEKNYPLISILLGLITVFYYLIFLNDTHSLLHTAAEYLSFIALLSSLFVASSFIA